MLLSIRGVEVHTGKEPGHEELIILELRDQCAPDGLGISFRSAVPNCSKGHDRIPRFEMQRLRDLAFLLSHCLELAFEIQESDLTHHGSEEPVVLSGR